MVAQSSGSGAIQVYPNQTATPSAQAVVYRPNIEVNGFTLTKLGSDGKIKLHNAGSSAATVSVDTFSYAELVERSFPTASSPGQAIEYVTGVADLNNDVTGDQDNIAVIETGEGDSTTTVTIPKQASAGITLNSADVGTTTIGLPATGSGTATAAGTIVYPGSTNNHYVGVQPTTDGSLRTLVHLSNSSAPTSFTFPVTLAEGMTMEVNEHGGVDIYRQETDSDGNVVIKMRRIDKPWAKDAAGRTWPASYAIDGNSLKLNINLAPVTDQAGNTISPTFPVVADPSVKRNCGIVTCSWYLSRRVTKNIADNLGVNGTMTSIAAGMICAKIPHPAGVAACAAGVAIVGVYAAYHIRAAANRGGCFVVRVNWAAYVAAGAYPPAIAKVLRFGNVPLSNKYCYAS